jgi:hypothetical protein
MRIFSQSIGTVVSLILFFLLASAILKPFYRAIQLAQAVAETAGYSDNANEIEQLTLALLPVNPRPIFSPSGALLGFSESLPEGDELIAAVKVDKRGHASVKQVVEPPRDPGAITRLANALYQQANFLPAARGGRFINSDAVLMFSKVTVPSS